MSPYHYFLSTVDSQLQQAGEWQPHLVERGREPAERHVLQERRRRRPEPHPVRRDLVLQVRSPAPTSWFLSGSVPYSERSSAYETIGSMR